MFVKIENYYNNSKPLLLNVDNIVSIEVHGQVTCNKDTGKPEFQYDNTYDILCFENKCFNITETQHEELCRALNRMSK